MSLQLKEISAGGLMEGGVNLTSLGLEGCFASFMATTRSSPSLTADPKDFVLGNFESCGATLATTPQDGTATADSLSPLTDTNDNDIPNIQIGTGAAGVDVKDAAVLSVTGTTSRTGTVSFHVCGPISTGTCDTGGVSAGSQAANANGTYVCGLGEPHRSWPVLLAWRLDVEHAWPRGRRIG